MTKIFHDWEFFEDGMFIHPISVGMVTDTGDSYYAIFEEANYYSQKTKWLKDNVYKHIEHELVSRGSAVKSGDDIAKDILAFISSKEDPELWAWYGAYDHVSLAQTYGPMIAMPDSIPWVTHDIKTLELLTRKKIGIGGSFIRVKGNEPKQDPATEHHALYDALHDRDLYNYYIGRI